MSTGRVAAVALVAGTLAGWLTSCSWPAAAAAALAAAALALVPDRRAARRALVFVAIGAAGLARGAAAREAVLRAPVAAAVAAAGEGVVWTLTGRLVRDAERVGGDVRLLVDAETLAGPGDAARPTAGRVQIYVTGQFAGGAAREWRAGRAIRAPMTLGPPAVWLNPGGASLRWQQLTARAVLVGTVKSALLVHVARGRWWTEAPAAVRDAVRRRVRALFPDDGRATRAIVGAILLGDRAELDEQVRERLQRAGTYHVLAISGGNVALVVAAVFVTAGLVTRSHRVAVGIALAAVTAYGAVVNAEASVMRAVTAAVVYLAADACALAPAAVDVLIAVAMLIAAIDPGAVIDRGAWLSFGATLGIVVCAGRWAAWAAARWRSDQPVAEWSRGALVGLLAATAAAELALLPVSAAVFSRVGVAGLLLNFVAIPMMAVAQTTAAAAVALEGLWASGASVAAAAARYAIAAIVDSARLVDLAPALAWRIPPPADTAIVAFYGTGIWCLARQTGASRPVAWAAWCASAAAIVVLPLLPTGGPAASRLRLIAADVGQGDALVLQFPTGHSLVVDAGAAGAGGDMGDRILTPVLWWTGVRRLDWLAFTHADVDHIGGAASIDRTFRPNEVWEGTPVPANMARRDLRDAVVRRGAVWRELRRADRFDLGGVHVDVVNPPEPDWERQRVRNDDSLVLRVRYRDVELLLTGDAGAEVEQTLRLDDLAPIRVLKVAHHGSRTSTSADFLARYAPNVAVISAGRRNLFGHPSPEVLDRLRSAGARVFRTDRDGAVILETDGHRLDVRTMTGRRWTVTVSGRP